MMIHLGSFSLGIACILLLLMAIGVVWSVVKLIEIKENLQSIVQTTDETTDEISQEIIRQSNEIYQQMDSRFDKLKNKLIKN